MHRNPNAILCLFSAFALCLGASPTFGALGDNNLLLIYNDPGDQGTNDGAQITAHYQSHYPGVHSLNLDDPALSPGLITYPSFITQIREPIRQHLVDEGLTTTVRVLVLTKGIPHQIDDINVPGTSLGNTAGGILARFTDSNLTYASVDSELTLLFHDLSTGEADDPADSQADNFVLNPYFQQTHPISVALNIAQPPANTLSKVDILGEGMEVLFSHWKVTDNDAGRLYLTARLDGHTVDDVKGMIDRAQTILVDTARYAAVLDGNETELDLQAPVDNDPLTTGGLAFDTARDLLNASQWRRILHDRSSDFFVGQQTQALTGDLPVSNRREVEGPVFFVAGLGANHFGAINERGWARTYADQLPHGAIFNTFESYNGRQFGGVSPHPQQAQTADWIADGGTLAIAHVWEPLTLGVAWNAPLIDGFFNHGLTWAEAAWSSIQTLSWQSVVIGDPLAKATLLNAVPQVELVTLSGFDSTATESDTPTAILALQTETPVTQDLSVRLSFSGADLQSDYQSNIPGFNSGSEAALTIPVGTDERTFEISILDDALDEGLEILSLSILESATDTNSDGFGESYGFLPSTAEQRFPIADTGFIRWHHEHFGTSAAESLNIDLTRDTEQDGLTDLWEYFLATDPRLPDSPGMIDSLDAMNATFDGPELTFEAPKSFPKGVRLHLEATTSLTHPNWLPMATRDSSGPWILESGVDLEIHPSPEPTDILLFSTETEEPRGFRRFRLELLAEP